MRRRARQPIRDTRRSGAESKRRRGPRLPTPPSRVTLGRPYAAQDGLEGLELELLRRLRRLRLRLHLQLELQARRIRRAHHGCAEPPELLSTCAVLGILLRTAVPTIAGVVTSYRLQGATRQIAADLQQARMSAIAENNRYSFRLVDTGTYSVHTTTSTTTARSIPARR